ncbi:peptidoglycan DD-metalloendopeptidase family protein [Paenibacillus sp. LMG 31456]|uniref:Peptidoglycan DD-metalloendopeptidase family protein n=1 Tax=Paenibacillus foliorum TaxID=2654974 RepID=A0A972K419_9BACL|nr:M23 family metallopeptidase [Paenibacillus foliorum]NOU96503.1 peptidoglycan DD-metalloendopeptidase family protein [Paenibacillus foliorum]
MKLKWGKKRYTFVIIPDANSSVRRFEVPKLIPYIAGAGLLSLVIVTLFLYVLHARTVMVASNLQTRVYSQDTLYATTVQEKNETIEQLQNEVIKLSKQTSDMKSQIDDIRKLEEEVQTIKGSDKKTASADPASTGKAMGGVMHPATQDEVKDMLEQTRTMLTDMNEEVDNLKNSIVNTKEEALAVQQKQRVTPSIWPVDSRTITSGFGLRQDPFTFRPTYHSGYDISAPLNSKVKVTADGVVQSTGSDSLHGNNIVVSHSDGLRTWYMHLNKINVDKGEKVEKGQVIGLVGSTGRSTGNHLHYEVLKNGVSIDPKPYLK